MTANTELMVEKFNAIFSELHAPFFAAAKGKRGIRFFRRYEWLPKEKNGGYASTPQKINDWFSDKSCDNSQLSTTVESLIWALS